MKKILWAKLTTGLLVLGVAGLVSGAPALATSWMIGDNDGYGLGESAIPDNANHYFDSTAAGYDGRTPDEIADIMNNGVKYTDTYSTTHPGNTTHPLPYSPQVGSVATFTFTGLGGYDWTKGGTLWVDMADFQASTFHAVIATYNGFIQDWAFDDGSPTTKVRSFNLSQDVLDSINSSGMLTVVIDRNISDDFYGFDYMMLSNPVPEPTTILLFGAGLAGLAAVGRRRTN